MRKRICMLMVAIVTIVTSMSALCKDNRMLSQPANHVSHVKKMTKDIHNVSIKKKGECVKSVCKVSKTPMSSITYYAKGHCRTCISKSTLRRTVHDAAKRYDVSDILITSVIAQESSFKPDARLGTQVGLMQVDLGWHRKKFHGDPYRPSVNVMVGTSILRDCLIRKHHDTRKALRCYNGGGDPHYAHKVLTATYQVKALL